MILQLFKNKRFILILLLAAIVAGYFWSSSRYPALNEKALMGSDTNIQAIGFDVVVPVSEKDSIPKQIVYNSINWMETNRKGMTFGIIFGALLLTLLPFFQKLQPRSRFANTLLGVLYGSPLGLCVNCSTPVAQGIFKASGRVETMMATMVSSPTLNVIVLTMLIAFFPWYLVALKIGATLIFILAIIPLLSRFFYPKPESFAVIDREISQLEKDFSCRTDIECDDLSSANESWFASIKWVFVNSLKNLWYIVKTTVPLMILAGILGAAVITVFPFETVIGSMPQGRITGLIGMFVLAVFGLFLPVPVAFDVIVTAILLNAGMPIKYAAVLLFTLGIFSIYPYSMIGKTLSWRFASSVFVILVAFGVIVGMIGSRYYQWDSARQEQYIIENFANAKSLSTVSIDRSQQGTEQNELLANLNSNAAKTENLFKTENLSVGMRLENPKNGNEKALFTRIDAEKLGITEHDNYSVQKMLLRNSVSRGIASGDVHNDGWPDVVVASNAGFGLYANKQGNGFIQQRIEIPEINDYFVMTVALVDLDNDGWLDLYFSTFGKGHFVIYNQKGIFLKENLKSLPNIPKAVGVSSPAFGDIDRDGKLDIVLGNVSYNKIRSEGSFEGSKNIWLKQTQNKEFEIRPLEGINGESLTSLLTDINGDGNLDLIIGNDIEIPDYYYFGDGRGNFKMLTKNDNFLPYSTLTTMSIATADVDNDLVPEIYLGQVSRREKMRMEGHTRQILPKERCTELTDEKKRKDCEKFYEFIEVTKYAESPGDVFNCKGLVDVEEKNACIAYKVLWYSHIKHDEKYCEVFPAGWKPFADDCRTFFAPQESFDRKDLEKAIPQKHGINMLFKKNENGKFEDKVIDFGLELGGWSWNAKFADLNNDGWQDMFVVNGYTGTRRTETNYLYLNRQGKKFEDVTEQSGMHSYLDTLSYTYIDADNDGDLDIIAVPTAGPISFYRNNTNAGNSITFQLNDAKANRFGIGGKVFIYYGDGKKQMREIQASGGYQSFDAPVAHFGLGDAKTAARIEIEWPDGEKSVLEKEFAAGAKYTISRE